MYCCSARCNKGKVEIRHANVNLECCADSVVLLTDVINDMVRSSDSKSKLKPATPYVPQYQLDPRAILGNFSTVVCINSG